MRMLDALMRPARINEDPRPARINTDAGCIWAAAQSCLVEEAARDTSNEYERTICGFVGCITDILGLGLGGPAARSAISRLLGACGCFEEGTLVATPDGLRPIEQIAVGDQVLAWNAENGETTIETVTALIRPDPKLIWGLETRDADGEAEVFFVTDDHPWFVEGLGWVETRNLRAGQRIETADDRGLAVLDIARTDRVERTYNLTVSGPHTFLVGEDGAVVHNCKQLHHWISRRIHAALQRHPSLRGAYRVRDPRLTSRAANSAAHRGYQTWHRQYDAEVSQWLDSNPNASQAQFEGYLRGVYARPEMAGRFP